ncbi:nitroreductase family protein [Brevibacillus fulvus]|uniref:Nitroreductase n=1 Tax=Brevibacillus fulvus TaxID=1125967 RepID=A0A938XXV6_9BACL|nr:nitroreductase family protein [Brevibacillus fulvus]MBM7589700.1 nitroreductase [Brevibacillus fulvus]
MTELEMIVTGRRTIRKTIAQPIDRQLLLELLEKAAYAPFHSKTEPWSVYMAITAEEKAYFLQCVLESYERNDILAEFNEQQLEKIKEANEKAFFQTGANLIVAADLFDDEKQNLESLGATAAFIQNLQLLAWEKKIGVVWRTNPYIFDRQFAAAFGIPETKRVVGSLHLGYFEEKHVPKPLSRRPLTAWVRPIQLGHARRGEA